MRCLVGWLMWISVLICHVEIALSAFNSVCIPGLCKNNGTCMERPIQGGFRCKCTEDFHGRFCDIKLPEVVCLSDRIVLTVGKDLVEAEVDEVDTRFVYLGTGRFYQSDCVSEDSGNELTVTLKFPFSGCGTTSYKDGPNFIYGNRLYLDTTHNASAVTRHRMVLLDWSCVYTNKYNISYRFPIKPAVNQPERQVSYGRFTMGMTVYRHSDFSEASQLRPPVVLATGQRLYGQVELLTSSHSGLVVTIRSCRASNDRNPSIFNRGYTHDIINRGCASMLDPSVIIHQSGTSRIAQFSIDMFMWTGAPAPIYLHCIVNVCNVSRFEQDCTPLCVRNSTRVRRLAEEVNRSPDLKLTIGPFLVSPEPIGRINKIAATNATTTTELYVEKQHSVKDGTKPEYIVLAVLAAVGFIAIVAICIVMLRRHSATSLPNIPKNGSDAITDQPTTSQSVRTISDIIAEDLRGTNPGFSPRSDYHGYRAPHFRSLPT